MLIKTEIKLKSGEIIELKDFFYSFYPVLIVFANKYIHDKTVCEDIVQDTFIAFWEKQKSFQNHIAVKGFFYTSVKNSCLDYLKHYKVEEKYKEYKKFRNDLNESFFDEILKTEAYGKVYEEINKLPEMGKKVLLLSMKDQSNEEIASALDIAINTVKTHKSRAYKVLRSNLKDLMLLIFPFKKERREFI